MQIPTALPAETPVHPFAALAGRCVWLCAGPEVYSLPGALRQAFSDLSLMGVEIGNAEQARAALAKQAPDLVILQMGSEKNGTLLGLAKILAAGLLPKYIQQIALEESLTPDRFEEYQAAGISEQWFSGAPAGWLRMQLRNTLLLTDYGGRFHRLQQTLEAQSLKADFSSTDVLDHCPAFVWVLQSSNHWSYLNQASRNFVGRFQPSAWVEAVHPEDVPELIRTIDAAWQAPHRSQCEIRVRSINGIWRLIRHNFICHQRQDCEGRVLIGSGEDVTDFRTAEEALLTRQRYSVAVNMARKTAEMENDFAGRLSRIRNIAAQALEASRVEIFFVPQGDYTKAVPVLGSSSVVESETLADLISTPALMAALEKNLPAIQNRGDEHTCYHRIMAGSQCVGLITATAEKNHNFGRSESDFLLNIGNIIQSLREKNEGQPRPASA